VNDKQLCWKNLQGRHNTGHCTSQCHSVCIQLCGISSDEVPKDRSGARAHKAHSTQVHRVPQTPQPLTEKHNQPHAPLVGSTTLHCQPLGTWWVCSMVHGVSTCGKRSTVALLCSQTSHADNSVASKHNTLGATAMHVQKETCRTAIVMQATDRQQHALNRKRRAQCALVTTAAPLHS
jgi:hypothetical protein